MLIECIKENEKRINIFFLIIEFATEYKKIENYTKVNNLNNTMIYWVTPEEVYARIAKLCDIGLVFLDKIFIIPNIPLIILTYMELKWRFNIFL